MTADLPARLLAAIEETERRERRRFSIPMPVPTDSRCPTCGSRPTAIRRWLRGHVELAPCGHALDEEQLVAAGIAKFAGNPDVLRRCAADRRMVEQCREMLESPAGGIGADPDYYGATSLAEAVLAGLAEGYGTTTEEEQHG